MLIAVDVSPISSQTNSQHKVRGVGMYIGLLKENLEKYDKRNQYIFTADVKVDGLKADLVHYPYLDPFFVTFPIIKKKKTVITVHDLIPISYPKHFPAGIKGNISWQINKRILKHADQIITDSEASKKNIVRHAGVREDHVSSVLLGVENRYKKEKISESQKQIIIKKFNLPERFFLYVGDVTWNKNLPKLVAAVKEVNIPIVMVGKALVSDFDRTNPWNRDRIIVMQESDSDLFIKPGFVTEEELVMLYNMTIAVCMPSIDEGFGLPVLEGMSCGAPVIVSRGGSLPEVAGEAGLYIDQDDYHDIGLKMKEISSNNNIWEKYSSKSQEQAKLFSIEKMIKETVKCYENI